MQLENKKKKPLNKIFLIGNGYDLSRGMKTSYKDFMKWYLMDSFNKATGDKNGIYKDYCLTLNLYNWKDPSLIKSLKNEFQKSIEDNSFVKYISHRSKHGRNPSLDIKITPSNDFIDNILKNCFDAEWNGIESSLYDKIKQFHFLVQNYNGGRIKNGSNVKDTDFYEKKLKEIKSINASLECLKRKLNEYLGHQKPKGDKDNFFSHLIESTFTDRSIDTKEVLFLNFNYTSNYGNLFSILKSRFAEVTISKIQIHGEVCSKNELGRDMVFGIGDEQEELYHEIESLYDDDWLHCMKSFHYFRNNSYQDLLGFIEKGDYEIFVIGHSCSITDRTLLSMMFEHEHCKKIYVLHYKGLSSYLKTTYNIARNFKDKVKMRKVVQPFNKHLEMQ